MKIKVKVKPGQILSLVDETYKAGAELDMDEKDAEPILGSCVIKVSKKKKKKPKSTPIKEELPKDEEETIPS